MDIAKRRFKIRERVTDFVIDVEVPKVKRRWWGKRYYDEKELIWASVGTNGQVRLEGNDTGMAMFKTYAAAMTFVKKIKEDKKETIV